MKMKRRVRLKKRMKEKRESEQYKNSDKEIDKKKLSENQKEKEREIEKFQKKKRETNVYAKEFEDVFSEEIPNGLPLIQGIEHQIDFVLDANIPNRYPITVIPRS